MNFDPNQQAAYLADMNAAVSAGAGSGKTTVLAERYVRLVTERGFKVNEVLTLTFTRKAAAEMRERIFKRLSASEHPLAKEALAQFDQARISTLDSFCSSLVRGASYRYGIAGDFRVDDSELAAIAEETAVEIIMRERNNADKLKTISRLVSSRSFEIIVKDLFADLAAASFSLVKQDNYAALARKQVAVVVRETKACVTSINGCCEKISALDDAKSKGETLRKAKEAARTTIPVPPDNEDFNEAFSDEYLAHLVETGDFFASSKSYTTPKSTVKDEALIELREITVGGANGAVGLKGAAKKLIVLAKTLQFREDMLVIGDILDAYKEKFIERKRQAGLLSFHDTLEMSVDVLLNDLGLRNFYKRRIKAVMIDEFQDNNELQKQLLYLLSEKDDAGAAGAPPETGGLNPNKLFFVGDEKQSIYRFRGADVAVFRGLSGELRNSGISLNTNYRSTPELVRFFNMIFPAVFGQAKEKFEAEFSPVESAPHKKASAIKPVEIYVQETKRGDKDAQGGGASGAQKISKDLSEALCVAERIVRGVASGEFAFHDVAVLFRSTSHQNEYERVFREAAIPFVAADPRGVYAEAPANDFYAILRLALYPLDRNAYATVLRSPFVKLGDESVFRILLDHPDAPFSDTFSEFHFANDAERARFDHGKHVFDELQARVDLEPLSSILTFLWYETGYRTFMLSHEATRPNAGHFDYLYTLALGADQRQLSASAFLNELAPLVGTTAKTETGEVPDVENEALFLTVHKSKGLEFPVVILAGAGGSGQGDRNNAPYYLSKEFGPVINMKSDTQGRNEAAVNYFYEKEKEHIQKQEEAEIKRLFYVAATRAERRLFIFGSRAITAKLEHALAESGEDNRVETLVKLPSPSDSGEARSRSFFDLLALGLHGADAKRGESDDSPQALYDVFSIETPDYAEYHERVKRLHRQTERLQDHAGVAYDASAFYATQAKPLPEPKTLFTTPTAMEEVGLFSRPAGVQGWLEPLPAFQCDDFLKEDEARRKKFGALCHRLIERLFAGADREEKPAGDSAEERLSAEESLRETRRLFSDESAARARALSDEASAVAKRFFASDVGKEAAKATRRASEFPFLLPMPCGKDRTLIIQGQIDLIYEINGQCVIIDFKTDAEIRPQNHRFQLACYTRAASAFSDLPPRATLVYLRNMRAVEFDPATPDEELARVGREAAN